MGQHIIGHFRDESFKGNWLHW